MDSPRTLLEIVERAILHWATCLGHHDGLARVLGVVQGDAVGLPLFALALAFLARRHGRLAVRTLATAGVALGLGMLVAEAVWELLPRSRPPLAYERLLRTDEELATCAADPEAFPVRDRVSLRAAFPSRHALTVGALAGALLLASWRLGLLAWLYGLLVVYGRLHLGRHWPTDLLAGLLLGLGLARIAWHRLPHVHEAVVAVWGRARAGGRPRT